MKIVIIGGGIAGSALAVALQGGGLDVVLADARPRQGDAGGAFLTLAPNGVNALRALGLGEVPEAAGGFEVSGIDFHNARGRQIAALSGDNDLHRYGARSVVLRRARLHAVLAERSQACAGEVLHDARLVDLRPTGTGTRAVFADGRSVTADAVVGADGIWSTVRRRTWPGAPEPSYTGLVDCGGWAEVDLPDTTRQQMCFGHRAFFGYTVKAGLAYWFSNVPRASAPDRGELDHLDQPTWLADIRALHDRDPAPVRQILSAAHQAVGAWPVFDQPTLAQWHTDRVCLIGDAAHAVSPSSGQGASLAIEDAATLGRWLRETSTAGEAFDGFTAERKARAEKIVQFGRQIGSGKVDAKGNLFRDLTLGMFLRLGAKATAEQYSYRTRA